MPWARASEMNHLVKCAGPLWLPHEPENKGIHTELSADWGSGCHEWKATGCFTGPYAEQIKRRVEKAGLDRLEWYPEGQHEISFAFNSPTRSIGCMEEGTEEERDAWKRGFGDEWSTGTADFIGDWLGMLWVDDLKTGSTNPMYPPTMPEDSAQIRWYALVASRYKLYHGPVYATITHWPRPDNPETLKPRRPKTCPIKRYDAVLTADQIDAFERHLVRIRAERLAQGPLRPDRDVCKFCVSKSFCPNPFIEEE